MELLSVAQLYKMDVVLTHIRDLIAKQQPTLIRKETAFSVYALAQKHGLRTEALQAARCTLSVSTMDLKDLAYKDKLSLMPGAFLHELWKFHQGFHSGLTSGLERFKKSPEELIVLKFLEDPSCDDWVKNCVDDIGTASVLGFTSFYLGFVEHSQWLPSKYSISQEDLRAFWEALTAVVQGSIAKAESDFALGVERTRSENEVQAKKDPSHPKYSDMPSADVILQSSDLVNFRVHRSALVTSSPFFRDMFSLPQPLNDISPDELPVVRVSEAAEVLNSLISMLYPVPPEIPDNIDNILTLLAATEKYEMGAVQSSIRAEVSRKKLLSPTDSGGVFRMYAVACSKRLIPELETAVRLTLDYPLTFESIGEALRSFDGWALRGLANFRILRVHNLSLCIDSFLDCQEGPSKIWAGCPFVEGRSNPPHLPSWLDPDSDESGFTGAIPTSVQYRDEFLEALQEHINENDCHFCSKVYVLKGKAYCAEMEVILELARKVPTRILEEAKEV